MTEDRRTGSCNSVDALILINLSLVPNTEFVLIDENDSLEIVGDNIAIDGWDMGLGDLDCLMECNSETLLWVHSIGEPLQPVRMPRIMKES